MPGCHEDRSRDFIMLQYGSSMKKVICITVIKGDDDSPVGNLAVPQRLHQLLEPRGETIAPDHLQLLGEMLRCDGKQIGVVGQLSHAVVHQNKRARSEPVFKPPSCGLLESPHPSHHATLSIGVK